MAQKAVSNKTGIQTILLAENSRRPIYDTGEEHKSVEVQAVTLDDFFKDYPGSIDFIKMDIDGAEGSAIQGMSFLLQKNKDIKIIAEFCPAGLKKFGTEPAEYLKLLLSYDFKLFMINERKKEIETVAIEKLLKSYTPEKGNFTNLFCKRD